MRKLRIALMVLAGPAAAIFAVHQFGDTPISRGYDTGFVWRAEPKGHIVLSIDPDGNMTCWLKLKVPATTGPITAATSGHVPLRVTLQDADAGSQWLSVTKNSTLPEDKFDWASGGTVDIDFGGNTATPEVLDWYIYPSNKSFDSRERARWRQTWFWISVAFFVLSFAGLVLEGVDKYGAKSETLSPQLLLHKLILNIQGKDDEESRRIQSVLEKVLLEGSTVQDALAPLKLSPKEQRIFWIKAAGRFRARLKFVITELNRYLARVSENL
jgi:hypothetical protein